MMKPLNITPELNDYLNQIGTREHPILTQCRLETAELPDHRKQIPPEQGQFFDFLVKLLDARDILELGTFTGYSSLVFALASADDARITTIEMRENYLKLAEPYWQQSKLSHKIDARLGKANDCLDLLLASGREASFDLIFIDADKTNLQDYYEKSLQLIRRKGVIIVDNVLWHGNVIDDNVDDKYTLAIRAFNEKLHADQRVDISVLPVGDGLTLIRLV